MKQVILLVVLFLTANLFAASVYFPVSSSSINAPTANQVLKYNSTSKAMEYVDAISLLSAASASVDGYLDNADWSTFNGKQDALGFTPVTNARTVSTTSPLSGGGALSSDLTLSISQAGASASGYLSNTDWTTFNGKADSFSTGNLSESTSSVLTITGGTGAVIGSGTTIEAKAANASQSGYLSSTDWSTFNGKQDALGFTPFANPMTAAGDVIYGGTSGVATALAKGTDGEVLKLVSGLPSWEADTGFANPMTAAGDLIYGGTSGAPTALAKGTDGKILMLVSGAPSWQTAPTGVQRYVADVTFNGTDLTKDVDVSASISDTRAAIIQLKQNGNDFEVASVSLKAIDSDEDLDFDSVKISSSIALPAGDYKLIVIQ